MCLMALGRTRCGSGGLGGVNVSLGVTLSLWLGLRLSTPCTRWRSGRRYPHLTIGHKTTDRWPHGLARGRHDTRMRLLHHVW